MSRLLISLSAVQTLLLALAGAKLMALETQISGVAAAAATFPASAATRDGAAVPALAALSRADIRKIMREELAAAGKSTAPRAGAAVAAPAETRLAAAPAAATAQIRAQLNLYLSKSALSAREMDDFYDKMAELPTTERDGMLRALRNAMNSGKLDARM